MMKTDMTPISNHVNLLHLEGVEVTDLDNVASWLNAFGMNGKEVRSACQQILGVGEYRFSNIEYRTTVLCTKR